MRDLTRDDKITTRFAKNRIATAILVVALTIIAAYVLFATGIFDKDPHVTVQAENRFSQTLTVALDKDYWPYTYVNANNQPSGHDVELMNMVANKLLVNLKVVPMRWEDCLDLASQHKVDIVLTCEYGDFESSGNGLIMTTPVDSGDFVAFGKKALNRIDRLIGKRIGLLENANISRALKTQGLDSWVHYYDSNRAAFEALAQDKCDYVIVRYSIGIGILKSMGEAGDNIRPRLHICNSNMCIGVNEREPELAQHINDIVLGLRQNGTIDKLNDKWLTSFMESKSVWDILDENPWVVIILVLCACSVIVLQVSYVIGLRRHNATLKAQQEAMEQAIQTAKAVSKSKTDFLFNMSHDIRTPMNAIIGFTDMARKHSHSPEKVENYLQKSAVAEQQLLSLINQVLEMARIESGKLIMRPQSIDLFASENTIKTIFGEMAQRKNLHFSTDYSRIKHNMVYADNGRLSQILHNIIGNSLKFTPSGGSIQCTVSETNCPRANYSLYVFEITDSGIGMSQEFMEHIFDEFARESTTTISGIQGTGLGMSIVRKIVNLMEGTIAIKSQQGKGTKITVSLPFHWCLEKTAATVQDTPAENTLNLQGKRVLLVEDNAMNTEIAQDVLQENGLLVDTADDGDEAVKKVAESAPGYYCVILMDVQMPRMNGYEATKLIRRLSNPQLAHIPIIALTANAFEEDRKNALEAGMNAHATKPIDFKKLLATIGRLIQ